MRYPGETVRSFFEAMEARDWDAAAARLSATVRIDFTETGERFDGPNFLAMNKAYPHGWSIEVVEIIEQDDRVATQVRVAHGDNVFWCAGFYRVENEVIENGTEHWVTGRSQPAPEWRRRFTTPPSGSAG